VLAVVSVAVFGVFTFLIVHPMGGYDQYHRGNEEFDKVFVKILLHKQQADAGGKKQNGVKLMMMFFVSMPQRIASNKKRYAYHQIFKRSVVDDVDSKKWKARQDQGKYGAMNGASQ